jgi:hypothetical protein
LRERERKGNVKNEKRELGQKNVTVVTAFTRVMEPSHATSVMQTS